MLTRRQLLGTAGAAGTAYLAGGRPRLGALLARLRDAAIPEARAATCLLTPAAIEGPFFVDERLVRSDITGDPTDGSVQPGVPLRLRIAVARADGGCTPVAGAVVDVWHASAAGLYSDEASNGTAGRRYLRGAQRTDGAGSVEFVSVYPGWYPGRTIHVHAKVRLLDDTATTFEFTTQLYFDDATSDAVMAGGPYATRGPRDTTNATDLLYDAATALELASDGASGWIGTIVLGVAGLPACATPETCVAALAAALPPPEVVDRRQRRVARRLARRLERARTAIARAGTGGARRARQYRRARAALAQLLAGARTADGAGTLGVPLPPIEEGTAAVLALLPNA